ncbi:MAG TPA: transglutaminase domain-containing protein [Candidatus Solibacter sp.]|jgi:hypothetical protein|nr:transglutaminase domain-containing protein [Candidatus Solibacter sp.]
MSTQIPEAKPSEETLVGVDPTEATGYGEVAEARVIDLGVPPVTTALAAAVSSAGAAWVISSMFRDFAAHLVALGGVALGVGLIILSYRVMRAAALQYAVIPVALLVGAALVAPDAHGGTMNTPALIMDSLRAGGLLQPPVAFDPGWRFILLVLFALLAAGSASVAIATNRPKLGVAIPVPLAAAGALIQPGDAEILTAAVALVCGVLAMTLAYGAELGSAGQQLSSAFETRRLLRGGAMALGLAVVVIGISRFGVLFPQPDTNHVVPPQRPQTPAEEPDRPLFSYKISSGKSLPLREGVIDFYSVTDHAWELPPYDARRLDRLTPPAKLPQGKLPADAAVNVLTVTVADAHGHQLPSLAGAAQVKSSTKDVLDFDPRTQALRLADRPVYSGYTYTVTAPAAPADLGKQLAATGKAERYIAGSSVANEFLQVPSPPNEVVTLLSQYSQFSIQKGVPEDPFNRLQFLRAAFYQKVIAAGRGTPVDLPASRVAQMLNGGEASPYEITAAEALLARWAGVPSRIGYGYYGGDKNPDGSYTIRPKHGSTWLEVYFPGHGWIAIVGVPPKAKPSTSPQPKNEQNIKSSDELALIVYIPVESTNPLQLFEYVRFYIALVAPWVAALVLLAICYPVGLKLLRSLLRRRWARRHGYPGRIAVAYAEFRDVARDLTIGDPAATPVEFLQFIVDDREHEELAWLVSRGLWGDLRRDLREEDAEAAERLAASVAGRIRQAQSGLNVVMAAIARTSLKEPYTNEVPNTWPNWHPRFSLPRRDASRRRVARPWWRWRLAATAAALLPILVLSGCAPSAVGTARRMPARLAPDQVGDLVIKREPAAEKRYRTAGPEALVSDGRVFTIHSGDIIEGSLQVSLFKSKVDTSDINQENMQVYCTDNPKDCTGHEAFIGFEQSLGTGEFHRVYVHGWRTYEMELSDERIYCWFPRGTQTMALLILRAKFTQAASRELRDALVLYQQGQEPSPFPVPSEPAVTLPSPPGIDLGGSASPSPVASASPQASPSSTP